MDRRAQLVAIRLSIILSVVATLSLVYLLWHASASCFPAPRSLSLAPFPRSSCDAASHRVVGPGRRFAKLRASPRWRCRTAALAASVLPALRGLRLLAGSSRVLCLAAGAGHAVDSLHAAGVGEATGVDLVEFPRLVRRADPHRLPFADGAFDLVLSGDPAAVSGALFPSRFASEAERAVRSGRGIAVAVSREIDPATVSALFRRSRVVDVKDVTLDGAQVWMLISQSNGTTSNHS